MKIVMILIASALAGCATAPREPVVTGQFGATYSMDARNNSGIVVQGARRDITCTRSADGKSLSCSEPAGDGCNSCSVDPTTGRATACTLAYCGTLLGRPLTDCQRAKPGETISCDDR